jgi:hypothetical protein
MIIQIIATLCAFFIKGLTGFANTLVFSSILGFTTNNIKISPIELILGYPSNIILSWKERNYLTWKIWFPLSIMVIAGSIPGVFILKNGDPTLLKIFFGIVVVGIGFEMLLRERAVNPKKSSKPILFIIGILSGLLCGLYGVGALLAAYVNHITNTNKAFKANICVVFLIENTFRLILYSLSGIITFSILKQIIILIPFMLIGLYLGIKSSSTFNEKIVKLIIIVMLIVTGIIMIINNLMLI